MLLQQQQFYDIVKRTSAKAPLMSRKSGKSLRLCSTIQFNYNTETTKCQFQYPFKHCGNVQCGSLLWHGLRVTLIIIEQPPFFSFCQKNGGCFFMCFIKFDKNLLKTGLSLISDRISLSKQNGWCDSFGTYCYYTLSAIMEELSIKRSQAQRLLHELEDAELILRQRQDGNRTKPFKIYIAPIKNEVSKMTPHEVSKMTPHEVSKMTPESKQYNQNNRVSSSSGSDVDELISSAEAQTGKSLSKEGRKKIKQVVAEHKNTIGNLSAYIRKCVINTATLENLEEPAGYAPTYEKSTKEQA